MLRATLLALACLLAAGCTSSPDESAPSPEPVRNSTDENTTLPASQGMCVEGAPDCDDTVEENAPPPYTLP